MKTLILTLSLIASLNAISQPRMNFNNDPVVTSAVEQPFDFNTKDYLPLNFDPYKGMFTDVSDALIEEPVSFDFDTKDYLSDNFDPYQGMLEYEMVNANEDLQFEFDTQKYLPKDFNPYKKLAGNCEPTI